MLFAMTGGLTQASLAAFIENPIDRFGPASQSINAVGAELKQMYQTAEGVAFLIIDAPDAQTITAISVAVHSIDRLEDIRIHRLQTTAKFAEGCRRAQQFRAVPQFPTR